MLTKGKRKAAKRANVLKEDVLNVLSSLRDNAGDIEKFRSVSLDISNSTLRFLWLLVGFLCSVVCFYQIYDRVCYYESWPTGTDVEQTTDPFPMPPLRIGGVDTESMDKFWNMGSYNVSGQLCSYLVKDFFKNNLDDVNMTDLWLATNSFSAIEKISIYQENKLTESVRFDRGKIVAQFPNKANSVWWSHRNTVLGEHTIFALAENIPLKTTFRIEFVHRGKCKTSGFLYAIEKALPTQSVLITPFGLTWNLAYSLKENNLLNKKRSPCVSADQFSKCFQRCLVKRYSSFACRLPFMPRQVNLIDCSLLKNTNLTRSIVDDAENMERDLLIKKDCNCHQPCHQKLLYYQFSSLEINDTKILRLNYTNVNDVISKSNEKFIYDGIKLLVDVGGSLCLFLGLCCLSLVKILHGMARNYVAPKRENAKSKRTRLIEKKVVQLLRKTEKPGNRLAKMSKIWVTVALIVFLIALIYTKVVFYFGYPTVTVVSIEQIDTFNLPNLIVCGDNNETFSKKREYADAKHTDQCRVHFLDLLNFDNLTLSEVWQLQKIIMPKPRNLPIYDSTVVATHAGSCHRVSINNSKNYIDILIYARLDFDSYYLNNCSLDWFELSVQSPDKNSFSPLPTRLDTKSRRNDAFSFETIKLTSYDSPRKRCTTRQVFENCAKNCYRQKLKDKIICKLPFMENVDELAECDDVFSAKKSYFSYLDAITRTYPPRDCRCATECSQQYFKTHLFYSDYSPQKTRTHLTRTTIFFAQLSNSIENLQQLPVYGLVSLLCDFGNILGITLGLSLLSISNIAFTFFKSFHFKRFRKFWRNNLVSSRR